MANVIENDYVGDVMSLAERGYRVFPVNRRTKIPLIKEWQHKATKDKVLIESWWRLSPDAIPGILCGDGLLVVDIDAEANWEHEFPYDPVQTPNGGYHVYYESDTCPTTASQLSKNVDTRGNGGFVVAWEPYKVPPRNDLPSAPKWLLNKLTSKKESEPESTATVGEGQRNASLTSFLGSLRAKGWGYDELLAAAVAYNERFCLPPDDHEQIEKTVLSVSRYTPFYAKLVDRALLRLKANKDAKEIFENEQAGVDISSGDVSVSFSDPLPDSPKDLIDGLIPSKGAVGIIGQTNTGKSLVTLEICASLVTGYPLWGQLTPNKVLNKIVYLLGEHTATTLMELYQLSQLPKTDKLRLIGPERLQEPPGKMLVSNGIQRQAAIDRLNKWCDGADLIVFDPLNSFVAGADIENDNTAMRQCIAAMQFVAETQGAACVILGHTGKPSYDQFGSQIQKNSYLTRGASAIEDALTHIHYLSLAAPKDSIFELEVRKFKGKILNDGKFRLQRNNLKHKLL